MPFVRGFLRVVTRDRWGRPVDPGYGVGEGYPDHGLPEGGYPDQGFNPDYPSQGFDPNHPSQGLPGYPGRPAHPIAPGGRPIDPGYGWGGGERPSHPIARPPWAARPWPPSPVDPDYGVDGGVGEGVAPAPPIYIPIGPDNTLPEVPGAPEPPIVNPPPGTIWPPLPPDAPVGKCAFLIYISGVGYRYGVFDIPAPKPDQGLPAAGTDPAPAPAMRRQ
jgi:hypothetical protein